MADIIPTHFSQDGDVCGCPLWWAIYAYNEQQQLRRQSSNQTGVVQTRYLPSEILIRACLDSSSSMNIIDGVSNEQARPATSHSSDKQEDSICPSSTVPLFQTALDLQQPRATSPHEDMCASLSPGAVSAKDIPGATVPLVTQPAPGFGKHHKKSVRARENRRRRKLEEALKLSEEKGQLPSILASNRTSTSNDKETAFYDDGATSTSKKPESKWRTSRDKIDKSLSVSLANGNPQRDRGEADEHLSAMGTSYAISEPATIPAALPLRPQGQSTGYIGQTVQWSDSCLAPSTPGSSKIH